MSESMLPSVSELPSVPDVPLPASAGALLRAAREAQGLHIAALAVALKIPVKKLEALEADQYELLPDTVFIRALAASICRALKIDATPILEKMPATAVGCLKIDESGINTPFRSPGDGSRLSLLNQLSRPFVLVVLLLLVGAALLFVFPFTPPAGPTAASNAEPVAMNVPPVISPPKENQGEALVPMPALTASSSLTLAKAPTLAPALPASRAAAEPALGLRSGESSVVVPGSGATTGLLVLKAHGVSWVRVVNAHGVVQVSKNMVDGEVVGVSGVTPLSVVIGSSNTTEVQLRGKPFDLTGIAKNNVARFEVK